MLLDSDRVDQHFPHTFPAESADELSEVFAGLPTATITATEAVEVSALFVGVGAMLGGIALLLGRAWRPLP